MLEVTGSVKHISFILVLLLDDGNVFVWGYGILGKGPTFLESAVPEMIPPTLFGQNDYNTTIKVLKIFSGLGHFAALTSKYHQERFVRKGFLDIRTYTDQP